MREKFGSFWKSNLLIFLCLWLGQPTLALASGFREILPKAGFKLSIWNKGYYEYDPGPSWQPFQYLQIQAENRSDRNIELTLEIKDDQSTQYWNRVNYPISLQSGVTKVRVPLDLFVGDKSRPGRALRLDQIRSVIISRNPGYEDSPLSIQSIKLFQEKIVPPEGVMAFDFGTETSPLFPGMTRFTKNSIYNPDRGFGIKNGKVWEPYPQVSNVLQPDSLYQDSLLLGDAEIQVDLPNGTYHVFMNLDYAGGYWGELPYFKVRKVFANGKPAFVQTQSKDDARKKYYFFSKKDDYWDEDVFDKYFTKIFNEVEFDVSVTNRKLNLRFQGENCTTSPCFSIALSTLIIIPAKKMIEGREYLNKVASARKKEFEDGFPKIVPTDPNASKLAGGSSAKNAIVNTSDHLKDKKEGLRILAADIMEEIPQNFRLESSIEEKVQVFSSWGESAVLTAYVSSDENQNLNLNVSDLVSGSRAVIPSQAVTLGWVSHRLQRLSPAGNSYRVAERYVIQKSDHEIRKNSLARIWSTLKIPKGTPPGTYKGHFILKGSLGETKKIPIEVRVFGFQLADLDFPVGPFNSEINENWWYPAELEKRREESFLKSIRKMRDYGLTAFSFSPKIQIRHEPGEILLDTSHVDFVMSEARALGFKHLVGYGDIFLGEDFCKQDPKAIFGFQGVTDRLDRISREKHWLPLSLVLCDEPLVEVLPQVVERLRDLVTVASSRSQVEWTVTLSATSQGEHSHPLYHSIAQSLSMPFLNLFEMDFVNKRSAENRKWAFYNNANRFTFGYYMYYLRTKSPLQMRLAWNWNQNSGNPYFALDSREDDENWCNNLESGDLQCTVFLDREIREGINDYRTALSLEQALKKIGSSQNRNVLSGNKLLIELSKLGASGLSENNEKQRLQRNKDIQNLRWQMSVVLEELSKLDNSK